MQDPYVYPGTNVLRNSFGILNQEELNAVELDVAATALNIFQARPFRGLCEERRLKAIHKAIFGSVYPWAGSYRANIGSMSKGRALGYTVVYGPSTYIPAEMQRIFGELAAEKYLHGLPQAELPRRMAYFYSEMDATHPFREGNSRTLRQFFSDLARGCGYKLNWARTAVDEESRNALYSARDRAWQRREYGPLEEIIARGLVSTGA